jgi:hypothetical protein
MNSEWKKALAGFTTKARRHEECEEVWPRVALASDLSQRAVAVMESG